MLNAALQSGYTWVTAVLLFTFVLPSLNGKELSSVGIDEHFAQDTERVNEESVLQLFPSVNSPLGQAWNVMHNVILEEIKFAWKKKCRLGKLKKSLQWI